MSPKAKQSHLRAPTVAVTAALALVALLVMVGGSAAAQSREPHEPIRITSDAELMLPDAIAGNGVRGGSGTVEDPYLISDWTISSDEEDGILLQDVSAHVVIRNVQVIQDRPREGSRGIWLNRADNVQLEEVNVSGEQAYGLSVWSSDVVVTNSVIQTEASGQLVTCSRSNLEIRQSRLLNGIPIRIAPTRPIAPCPRIHLEHVHVESAEPGLLHIGRELVIHNTTGYWQALIQLAENGDQAVVDGNQLLGLAFSGLSSGNATLGPNTVWVRNNTFRYECEEDCPVAWAISFLTVPGWQARILDNDIRGFGGDAMELEDSPFVARRNVIVDSGWKHPDPLIRVFPDSELYDEALVQGVPYQVLSENDIVRSPRDSEGFGLRYPMRPGEAGPLDARNNYWGPRPPTQEYLGEYRPVQPRWFVSPTADIDPWADEPFILSLDEVEAATSHDLPGPAVWAVAAALAAAAWAVQARRWGR